MTVRQRQFHDFEFIKLRTVRIITNCQLTNWANRCSSLQSLKFSADHQELENRTDKEAVTNILHRKAQWICLRFPFCPIRVPSKPSKFFLKQFAFIFISF